MSWVLCQLGREVQGLECGRSYLCIKGYAHPTAVCKVEKLALPTLYLVNRKSVPRQNDSRMFSEGTCVNGELWRWLIVSLKCTVRTGGFVLLNQDLGWWKETVMLMVIQFHRSLKNTWQRMPGYQIGFLYARVMAHDGPGGESWCHILVESPIPHCQWRKVRGLSRKGTNEMS